MFQVKPLAIDLFAGLGGWTDGLLAESWQVIGFDIERHVYGEHRYPAQLVVQDVLTLHGSQFRDADLIVASPPCQEYSYMAMPWSRGKAKAAAIRADETGQKLADLNRLFNACFRIQREACEAAGRHIPMIVENVKGAQPWVGRARWSFGSFYLWGDVPALMPPVYKATKVPGFRFDGRKTCFQQQAIKNIGGSWFNVAHNTTSGKGQNPDGRKTAGAPHIRDGERLTKHLTNPSEHGRKNGGDWFGSGQDCSLQRRAGSKSSARKYASAVIAKIPLPLSRFIGATFKPREASHAA
jgi:hypothetical protein